MKVMMMILSLMVLVSCNGDGGSNNNKNKNAGSSSSAYSQKQIDALNCNEDILGWADEAPMDVEHALQMLEDKAEFEECGHFDLYIDEVLVEHPKAKFLLEIKKAYLDYMANGGSESEDGEEEDDQDSEPDQWGDR